MNKQAFIQGYKLEKQAIEWGQALTNALPNAGLGAAIGGIPAALYGGLTAKKDESPWWRAAKFGLGGAGLGGLAGGGYGLYEDVNRQIKELESNPEIKEVMEKSKAVEQVKPTEAEIYNKKLNIIKSGLNEQELANLEHGTLYRVKDKQAYINNLDTILQQVPKHRLPKSDDGNFIPWMLDKSSKKLLGKDVEELTQDELMTLIKKLNGTE